MLQRVTSVGIHLHGLTPDHYSSEEAPQRWRAVDDAAFNLTDPRFEPQASRTDSKIITTEPTGWSCLLLTYKFCLHMLTFRYFRIL